MSLSLWQPERFIRLVTEVSVELQPLSFFFVQQEAIDVREQLIRRHRGYKALSVQSELVHQHHAEVGSGDSECLSTERHKPAINNFDNIKAAVINNLFIYIMMMMMD